MNCLRKLFSRRADGGSFPEDLSRVATKPTEESPEEWTGKKEHAYSKYGLPSPPGGENPQTPEEATKQMIQDGFRKYTRAAKLGTDKSKVLYFLYGRGFYFAAQKLKRKDKVKRIVDNKETLKRAVRLVNHDGDIDVTIEFQDQYRTLCKTLKGYFAQKDAFGIPLPNDEDEKTLQHFFRFQKQGNCFLLAPCVAVGYLMQLQNIDGAAPLDLTQYVRNSFDDRRLYRYLVHDSGGDAVKEFKTMIEALGASDSGEVETLAINSLKRRDSEFGLKQRLQLVGPGIVSNFEVSKHFGSPDHNFDVSKCGYMRYSNKQCSQGQFIWLPAAECEAQEQDYEVSLQTYLNDHRESSCITHPKELEHNANEDSALDEGKELSYDEKVKNASTRYGKRNVVETHVMLVIGGRYDGSQMWFLLQNWWKKMQLVEVSAQYLKACRADITFVSEGFKFASEDERTPYSLNGSLFADANYFDRAEKTEGGLSPPTLDRT